MQDRRDPLEDAVAAELAGIKAMRWSGTVHLPSATKTVDLLVNTYVEPFVRARTMSYEVGETPDRAHRVSVEGEHAYFRIEDLEEQMLPQQALHEREQFGLYGYLLKLLVWQKAHAAKPLPDPDRPWLDSHPGLPSILFFLRGRQVTNASYNIHKPFGEGMIRQEIAFSGTIGDPALGWPRTIDIAQDGKAYSKLVLESFTIEPA